MRTTYGTRSRDVTCCNSCNRKMTTGQFPLPKSREGWKDPTARRWALLKGTSAKVLAELAKGERLQGQRWAPRVCNPEHCPYSEGELTNLVRFAEMNLMFLKASYFHFEHEESTDMFVKLMDPVGAGVANV